MSEAVSTAVVLGLAVAFVMVLLVAFVLLRRGIVLGSAGPEAASLAGCQCDSCVALAEILGAPGSRWQRQVYVSPSSCSCPRCDALPGDVCVNPEGFPVYLYCAERLARRDELFTAVIC